MGFGRFLSRFEEIVLLKMNHKIRFVNFHEKRFQNNFDQPYGKFSFGYTSSISKLKGKSS